MALGGKLAAAIGNLALVCTSLGLSYLALNVVWLLYGPALLPSITNLFPVAAMIWWQPSAPDPVNQDYIAIAGDSYAAGTGDWQAARVSADQPFTVADVVHARLGTPVLTIGQSGAGTPEGLVLFPTRAFEADRCLIFGRPRRPRQIVLLFYEGNDLNNNVSYVRRTLRTTPEDPALAERTARHLREHYAVTRFATCLGYVYTAFHAVIRGQIRRDERTGRSRRSNWITIDGAAVEVPANLHGPALELSESERRAALLVAERSIAWVRETMPGIPLTVALMPSVLTTYELANDTVSIQTYQRGARFHPASRVATASDAICSDLQAIVRGQGARFIDLRPAMRNAARHERLHGPRDWKHFNRAGYTVVGETVAAALSGEGAAGDCANLSSLATSRHP